MINTRSYTQGRLFVHPGSRIRSDCNLVIKRDKSRDEDDDRYETKKIMKIMSWISLQYSFTFILSKVIFYFYLKEGKTSQKVEKTL